MERRPADQATNMQSVPRHRLPALYATPGAMAVADSTSHDAEPEYTRVEFRSGCGCCGNKPAALNGAFLEGKQPPTHHIFLLPVPRAQFF